MVFTTHQHKLLLKNYYLKNYDFNQFLFLKNYDFNQFLFLKNYYFYKKLKTKR